MTDNDLSNWLMSLTVTQFKSVKRAVRVLMSARIPRADAIRILFENARVGSPWSNR